MKQNSKTVFPGIQRAIDFIKDGVSSSEWPQGTRMPSIRRLAQMAGVSLATMFKAIHILKSKGIITSSSHGRFVFGAVFY
jgi:GntR family transcriptional regulator of abcA and norABC